MKKSKRTKKKSKRKKKGKKSKKSRIVKENALAEIVEELPYESEAARKISDESEIEGENSAENEMSEQSPDRVRVSNEA